MNISKSIFSEEDNLRRSRVCPVKDAVGSDAVNTEQSAVLSCVPLAPHHA